MPTQLASAPPLSSQARPCSGETYTTRSPTLAPPIGETDARRLTRDRLIVKRPEDVPRLRADDFVRHYRSLRV